MGKRKGICLLSLCLLMLFAGGCGTIKNGNESNDGIREQEEPIVIRFAWWGEQARNDKTREAVALFMEKIRIFWFRQSVFLLRPITKIWIFL